MIKNIGIILAGIASVSTIPSIASTTKETMVLTPGQKEFIRQFDAATGRNFSSLAETPGAIPIIQSASFACGNVALQKEFVYSAGGNKVQAEYASKKFESLFCSNK